MKEVVIVSATRTPIGSFNGVLSSVSAPHLGATAIRGAIAKIKLNTSEVDEVYMGNVLQAGIGQAPARQAAIFAGLSDNVPCTTINKVCSSGMKAIMIASESIRSGQNDVVIAGGMENMSQVPYYLSKARNGYRLGHDSINDGLVLDGLTDVYKQTHMGVCAEICAEEMKLSRKEQDEFALKSYQRSKIAWDKNLFDEEIIPVQITQRRGKDIIVKEDEEYRNIKTEKVSSLRPVFKKEGTITAANASTINDGAAALILMSKEKANNLNLQPIAKVISYADASQKPEWFTTAPAKALPIAIKKANININDIDFFELNEAFSVVGLANTKKLNLDIEKVNVNGGAVSLGHPLGASGARIMVTLINILKQNKAKLGAAGICNGGGGASAIVIENSI